MMEENIRYSIDRAREAQQQHEQKHNTQLEISGVIEDEEEELNDFWDDAEEQGLGHYNESENTS